MNKKFETIEKFTDAVRSMTETLQMVESSGMSVKDIRNVLNVIDPDTIELIDNISVSLMSNEFIADYIQDNFMPDPTHVPETTVTETAQPPIVIEETQSNWPEQIQESNIREICECMIECGFGYQATLDMCAAKNIKCSKYTLSTIRSKKKWTDITDEYFTKNGREYTAVKTVPTTSDSEPAKVETTPDFETSIVFPESMLKESIKNELAAEHGSIKRVYAKFEESGKPVTIFDVFNVKYEGKRNSPIKCDDMCVVARFIAPAYGYNIPSIAKVMRDRCDVIIDGAVMHQIRKIARKAGCVAGETDRCVSRHKDGMSEDDDKIAHVLVRMELNILQTFLHFRATPYPITIFDAYRVKQKIANVTDNDIRVICVNLQRSAGVVKPTEIAEIIKEKINVDISREDVIMYIKMYEDLRRLRAQQCAV